MLEFDPWILTPMIGICLATLLSLIVGLEREFYAKAAGLRTYTLVGMGSAVFTAVSKWGFQDVVFDDFTRFDGARVAAQIVTGVGFLGAGLIFVRKSSVHGLTTAAGIWFVAAVGMAAGAGLYLIAALVAALYLVVMIGLRPLAARMPHSKTTIEKLVIQYADGRGILRLIMEAISELGLKVIDLEVVGAVPDSEFPQQEVRVQLEGSADSLEPVADQLGAIAGVIAVKRV